MSQRSSTSQSWARVSFLLLLISGLLVVPSMSQQYLQQTYCSNQNTGSSNLANSSIYQSLGNCQGICRGSFSFGVVLGRDCWCSNTAPSNQQSISSCSDTCFGYPYENCGNAGSRLFGYISTGAQIGSQSSASSLSSSSSSSTPSAASSAGSTTESVSGLRTASETSISTPITSQSLRTSGGTVYTATVTIMPTGATAENPQTQSRGISGGSIAGIVVGVIIAAIVLIAAIIFGLIFWRRRRNAADDGEAGVNRNTSVLSGRILLGSRAGVTGNPYAANNAAMQERRGSKPLVTDQRLNPNAFMQHDDGSRSSFVSMQDNQDYTRTLNVRNPDPH